MGRRERRALERMTRGSRPDALSDHVKSWVLNYPADAGQPSLKPEIVRVLQVLTSVIVLLVAWYPWRRQHG